MTADDIVRVARVNLRQAHGSFFGTAIPAMENGVLAYVLAGIAGAQRPQEAPSGWPTELGAWPRDTTPDDLRDFVRAAALLLELIQQKLAKADAVVPSPAFAVLAPQETSRLPSSVSFDASKPRRG